jgi:hypothetical protein
VETEQCFDLLHFCCHTILLCFQIASPLKHNIGRKRAGKTFSRIP